MSTSRLSRVRAWGPALFSLLWLAASAAAAEPQLTTKVGFSPSAAPLIYRVTGANQRLEMTVNTSRLLTLDEKIPQAQVNNPELLELTPISANQIQVSAKKTGVTQINLWTEEEEIRTIDVVILGDAQELEMTLRTVFPKSALRVIPLSNSVIISGHVDHIENAKHVEEIAKDFYPKVINSMTVGGVQQVLLQVKVMEVSRSKLRTLGSDFAYFNGDDFIVSSVSGLIASATGTSVVTSGGETFAYGVTNGNTQFLHFIEALRQNNLLKILAEPKILTVSGRPAFFNAGGEFPILVPQSLGTVSIEYKKFGTQVDFVPIVLGNGAIRLEVRPRVSEIDNSRGVTINNVTVPGLRVREIDTAAEMRPGQTMAIAGLVQTRVEAETKGLPWISELPYVGVPFRRVTENFNEVELLITITPQLVDAMDPHEVPPCGPGQMTDRPCDCELYMQGYIEVPRCGPGGPQMGPGGPGGPMGHEGHMHEGATYGPAYGPSEDLPHGGETGPAEDVSPDAAPVEEPAADELPPEAPADEPPPVPQARRRVRTTLMESMSNRNRGGKSGAVAGRPAQTARKTHVTPTKVKVAPTASNRHNPVKPTQLRLIPAASNEEAGPGFIGPTGYDVIK